MRFYKFLSAKTNTLRRTLKNIKNARHYRLEAIIHCMESKIASGMNSNIVRMSLGWRWAQGSSIGMVLLVPMVSLAGV